MRKVPSETVDQWIAKAKEGKSIKKAQYLSDISGTKESLVEKITKSGDDPNNFDISHNDITLTSQGLKRLHTIIDELIKLKDEIQLVPKEQPNTTPKPPGLKIAAVEAKGFPGSGV